MMSASDSLLGSFFWSLGQGPSSSEDGTSSSSADAADAPGPWDNDEFRKAQKRIQEGFYRSERVRAFIARCLAFDLVPFRPDSSPASDSSDPTS